MPRIEPFAGIRFDSARVGRLDDVVAPPYDVIMAAEEERLRARSSHNIVYLDLPRDEGGADRYSVAGKRYREWLASGALVRDPVPRFYVMQQKSTASGSEHVTTGLVAAVGLEPLGTSILPHEETLVGPKADRLSLMRATAANLSPIYGIYADPSKTASAVLDGIVSREPLAEVADDTGVRHGLWSTSDPNEVRALREAVEKHIIFIADGHHRYKTALVYADERREGRLGASHGPADRTMMFLVNVDSEDLTILPVHRLVRGVDGPGLGSVRERLEDRLEVIPSTARDQEALLVEMRSQARAPVFGLYLGPGHGYHLLALRRGADIDKLVSDAHSPAWKRLDVTLLHRLVVEGALGVARADVENQSAVAFTKDAADAVARVDAGEFQLALFLNPTPVAAVDTIARNGETMPQKSTYFYPKPATGLVINPLD